MDGVFQLEFEVLHSAFDVQHLVPLFALSVEHLVPQFVLSVEHLVPQFTLGLENAVAVGVDLIHDLVCGFSDRKCQAACAVDVGSFARVLLVVVLHPVSKNNKTQKGPLCRYW